MPQRLLILVPLTPMKLSHVENHPTNIQTYVSKIYATKLTIPDPNLTEIITIPTTKPVQHGLYSPKATITTTSTDYTSQSPLTNFPTTNHNFPHKKCIQTTKFQPPHDHQRVGQGINDQLYTKHQTLSKDKTTASIKYTLCNTRFPEIINNSSNYTIITKSYFLTSKTSPNPKGIADHPHAKLCTTVHRMAMFTN